MSPARFEEILSNSVQIGEGCYRTAYKTLGGHVIKVAHTSAGLENQDEIEFWKLIKHMKISVLFNPVLEHSPCYRYIMTKYLADVAESTLLNWNMIIPNIMYDPQVCNFGHNGVHPVIRDYGSCRVESFEKDKTFVDMLTYNKVNTYHFLRRKRLWNS